MSMSRQEKLKQRTPEQEVKALIERELITHTQLREMLKDDDSDTRIRAVFIIRTGKLKDMIPELAEMLSDMADDVLISVLQTLEEFNAVEDGLRQFIGFQRFYGVSEQDIKKQLERLERL